MCETIGRAVPRKTCRTQSQPLRAASTAFTILCLIASGRFRHTLECMTKPQLHSENVSLPGGQHEARLEADEFRRGRQCQAAPGCARCSPVPPAGTTPARPHRGALLHQRKYKFLIFLTTGIVPALIHHLMMSSLFELPLLYLEELGLIPTSERGLERCHPSFRSKSEWLKHDVLSGFGS